MLLRYPSKKKLAAQLGGVCLAEIPQFLSGSHTLWGWPPQMSKAAALGAWLFPPYRNTSKGQSCLWSSPIIWQRCCGILIIVWQLQLPNPAFSFFLSWVLLPCRTLALWTLSIFFLENQTGLFLADHIYERIRRLKIWKLIPLKLYPRILPLSQM